MSISESPVMGIDYWWQNDTYRTNEWRDLLKADIIWITTKFEGDDQDNGWWSYGIGNGYNESDDKKRLTISEAELHKQIQVQT